MVILCYFNCEICLFKTRKQPRKVSKRVFKVENRFRKVSRSIFTAGNRVRKVSTFINMKKSELTSADIWAMFAETSRLIKENREQIKLQGERYDKSLAETRLLVEKNSRQIEWNNEQFKLQGERIDKNSADMAHYIHVFGKFTNKLGCIVESLVMPGLVDKFNEKGFSFDSVSTNVEFLNEERDGNLTEVDALLENGKYAIAVETKTDMQVSDVNAHIKRLKVLRGLARFKGKKIYGALSTAVARKRPVSYALEHGFFVLKQPDVMRVEIIDFPKGRSAKAY